MHFCCAVDAVGGEGVGAGVGGVSVFLFLLRLVEGSGSSSLAVSRVSGLAARQGA